MEKELGGFIHLAYVLGIDIEELYETLDACPCFGYSSRRFGIDDYDSLDSETEDYEIRIIIKWRYRK